MVYFKEQIYVPIGTNVNFCQELVYLTFILRNLMFIFSTSKTEFLKQLYNMCFTEIIEKIRRSFRNVGGLAVLDTL